jgi:hypothetical protein
MSREILPGLVGLGLGARDLELEAIGLHARHHLAGAHALAFLRQHLLDDAAGLGQHGGLILGLERGRAAIGGVDRADRHLADFHRHRGLFLLVFFLGFAAGGEQGYGEHCASGANPGVVHDDADL